LRFLANADIGTSIKTTDSSSTVSILLANIEAGRRLACTGRYRGKTVNNRTGALVQRYTELQE